MKIIILKNVQTSLSIFIKVQVSDHGKFTKNVPKPLKKNTELLIDVQKG